MNNCLADLSRLIPAEYLKKGRGRVEKTEIIEMAIRHMKHLQGLRQGECLIDSVAILPNKIISGTRIYYATLHCISASWQQDLPMSFRKQTAGCRSRMRNTHSLDKHTL